MPKCSKQYKQSPTKIGTDVRQLVDCLAPPVGLLCKLGSIVVHVDEGLSDGGHAFDWTAIRSLIADREVQQWLESMDAKAFLPRKRALPEGFDKLPKLRKQK